MNPNHVITAISSSKSYVTHSNLNPLLLLSNSAKDDFKDYSSDKTDYDSVLIGLSAESLNYPNLNNAFRILNQPGSQLIATHASKYFADKDNQLSLGPGGFVKALEYVTDKKAIICGKPSDEFFISCLKSLNLRESDWKDVAIIGDDALSDLGTSLPLRKVLGRFHFIISQIFHTIQYVLENIAEVTKTRLRIYMEFMTHSLTSLIQLTKTFY